MSKRDDVRFVTRLLVGYLVFCLAVFGVVALGLWLF